MSSKKYSDRLQDAIEFHQQGQFLRAIELYNQLKEEESCPELSNNLASAQMAVGQLQAAAFTLEQALRTYPNNPDLQFTQALHHASSDRLSDAILLAESASSQMPKRVDFLFNLANLYYQGQRLDLAEATYQEAIELEPNLPQAHFNLGLLYYQRGALTSACSALNSALEHAPDFHQASFHLGQILAEQGHYADAVIQYQKALLKEPNNPDIHKAIGMSLHIQGELEQAQHHFHQALVERQSDEETLTLLANSYRDLGDGSNAETYYRRVLQLNSQNEIAQENLRQISRGKIAAWHLPMLADRARNAAFQQAINNQVRPGDLVLDIGTGSGLLAMMAARAGAEQVLACEMVPELAEVATQVIENNELSACIRVVNQKSTQIILGKELPRPANVLVSEILDAGLLGEGVLPTFRHAKANLLADNATLIPKGAKVQACLIQCDPFQQMHPIGEICGFDLSAFNQFNPKQNYMTLSLNETPHQKLTAPFTACEFDFDQLPPPASQAHPNRTELTITIAHSGELHGVAFWFDLQLDDNVHLCSGPGGDQLHWGQAVYFFEQPRHVQRDDKVQLLVFQSDTQLAFKAIAT